MGYCFVVDYGKINQEKKNNKNKESRTTHSTADNNRRPVTSYQSSLLNECELGINPLTELIASDPTERLIVKNPSLFWYPLPPLQVLGDTKVCESAPYPSEFKHVPEACPPDSYVKSRYWRNCHFLLVFELFDLKEEKSFGFLKTELFSGKNNIVAPLGGIFSRVTETWEEMYQILIQNSSGLLLNAGIDISLSSSTPHMSLRAFRDIVVPLSRRSYDEFRFNCQHYTQQLIEAFQPHSSVKQQLENRWGDNWYTEAFWSTIIIQLETYLLGDGVIHKKLAQRLNTSFIWEIPVLSDLKLLEIDKSGNYYFIRWNSSAVGMMNKRFGVYYKYDLLSSLWYWNPDPNDIWIPVCILIAPTGRMALKSPSAATLHILTALRIYNPFPRFSSVITVESDYEPAVVKKYGAPLSVHTFLLAELITDEYTTKQSAAGDMFDTQVNDEDEEEESTLGEDNDDDSDISVDAGVLFVGVTQVNDEDEQDKSEKVEINDNDSDVPDDEDSFVDCNDDIILILSSSVI